MTYPHPNPAAYPPQHSPPPKRKVWPWVVGALALVFFGFVGCTALIATSVDNGGNGGGDTAAASGDGDQAQQDVNLAFGESHSWDNEQITISAPQPVTVENQFAQPAEGNRFVGFDVTVANIGDQDNDVAGTEITVQFDGRVVQENFAESDVFPTNRIPPGGEVTWRQVYEIPDVPGELRISVRPDVLAETTAYFVGQV